jgi:methylglutaconyl-CoA hydratase
MHSQPVTRSERRGAAAWITLDSPANRNALSEQLVAELLGHLEDAMADASVRCVVLTGAGPAFCSGADLKSRGAGIARAFDAESPFVRVLKLVWRGEKPVIAGVNGHAFGGGIGLAAACDISVGVAGARFAFSEVRVGLVPATISVVVVRRIGVHHTRRLFLTGERFDAAQARDYGLLHRVVPPEDLAAALQAEVDAVCLGGPIAIREAKALVHTVAGLPLDEGFAHAERLIGRLFDSEEGDEGRAAFAERRPPRWVAGR